MLGLASISPLGAQTSDLSGGGGSSGGSIIAILNAILVRVNNLPPALVNLQAYTNAWMSTDTSTPTSTMQGNFTQLGNYLTTIVDQQNAVQSQLNASLLNNDGSNVYNFNYANYGSSSQNPATTSNLQYANDLVYSSLLGIPFFAKDPRNSGGQGKKVDSRLNYIMNASGLNLYHIRPATNWQGSQNSQTKYQGFYNTVMAATSFNGYILSDVYADKNQFTTLQQTLIKQATDPKTWFVEVGKENIGYVLRQLLIYQSQIFVLLTEMIQIQKQMVTAQAINNSVLMAVNMNNENLLVSGAQGKNPSL
jgi:hypothetical protein